MGQLKPDSVLLSLFSFTKLLEKFVLHVRRVLYYFNTVVDSLISHLFLNESAAKALQLEKVHLFHIHLVQFFNVSLPATRMHVERFVLPQITVTHRGQAS